MNGKGVLVKSNPTKKAKHKILYNHTPQYKIKKQK
jgi:hypothetical protein